MSRRRGSASEPERRGGLAELLRTLLAGVPWSERATGTETLKLQVPRGGRLRIDNPNGHTRVIGEDRDDVEAIAEKTVRAESPEAARKLVESIGLVTTELGDAIELEVEVPRRWNRRGHVHLELRVPREIGVEISASNGKISVEGLRGPVRAQSSNGAVSVREVVGDLEIKTSNARLCTRRCCGRLVAHSSNGKVEIDGHRGAVDASTSNGVIHARLEALGSEGVALATSNGRIVLELPEDTDAELDVRVDNGLIRNLLTHCRCTRRSGGRLLGTLGRGGPPIKIRASNGSVVLR